jgi:hypothetical protein
MSSAAPVVPESPAVAIGPNYKDMKPKATQVFHQNLSMQQPPTNTMDSNSVSTPIHHENVHILPQTPQLIALLTSVVPASARILH